MYMFVRTESSFGYEQMFSALIKYAKEFYYVHISINTASIDSDAIASALTTSWPDVDIPTCWEHLHLLRQSRMQTKLVHANHFIEDTVQPHLRLLHACHSLKSWRDENEPALTDWLASVYLTPRWER